MHRLTKGEVPVGAGSVFSLGTKSTSVLGREYLEEVKIILMNNYVDRLVDLTHKGFL